MRGGRSVALLVDRFPAGLVVAAVLAARAFHPAVLPRPAARRARRSAARCVSPADGRVVEVGRAQRPLPEARGAEDQRVHERVQRALQPLAGRRHGEGALVLTRRASSTPRSTRPRSRTSATRCGCARATGHDVTCVQVAGLIARRILCYVGAGAALERGQRFGFIRFGSRVDLYLPLDAELKAAHRRQGVRRGDACSHG